MKKASVLKILTFKTTKMKSFFTYMYKSLSPLFFGFTKFKQSQRQNQASLIQS